MICKTPENQNYNDEDDNDISMCVLHSSLAI